MNDNNINIFEFRLGILKQEIVQLQNNIRNYNNFLIIVKGWSITIFSAILAYAIKESKSEILILSPVIVIMFWLFDAYLRRIQQFFISRYNKIEWFLRNPKLLLEAWEKQTFTKLNFPDLTGQKSVKDIKFKTSYFRVAIRMNVSFLYLIQLVALSFAWLLLFLGVL